MNVDEAVVCVGTTVAGVQGDVYLAGYGPKPRC